METFKLSPRKRLLISTILWIFAITGVLLLAAAPLTHYVTGKTTHAGLSIWVLMVGISELSDGFMWNRVATVLVGAAFPLAVVNLILAPICRTYFRMFIALSLFLLIVSSVFSTYFVVSSQGHENDSAYWAIFGGAVLYVPSLLCLAVLHTKAEIKEEK